MLRLIAIVFASFSIMHGSAHAQYVVLALPANTKVDISASAHPDMNTQLLEPKRRLYFTTKGVVAGKNDSIVCHSEAEYPPGRQAPLPSCQPYGRPTTLELVGEFGTNFWARSIPHISYFDVSRAEITYIDDFQKAGLVVTLNFTPPLGPDASPPVVVR
ncbi:hypothetical protein ACLIMP_04595 [Novosphingobium aerophilum]|uniref:hypothetical protein n=1 Tax=Novosphingobium TaxID=165696 RepID=UPI002D79F03B|nr:hypothetical protein [Novosphingobium sp. RL4]WRT93517.1 hypothetical protein U9J33_03130 [Novosphingobium sp. RL4]